MGVIQKVFETRHSQKGSQEIRAKKVLVFAYGVPKQSDAARFDSNR